MTKKEDPPYIDHPHVDDLERITQEDKKWFEDHPDRSYRLRFSSISEIWEVMEFNPDPDPSETVGVVTAVHNVMPGIRIRRHYTIRGITRRPEDLSDEEVKSLFEHPERHRGV